MTPVPINPEMLIIQYAAELGKVKAENARLLAENAQLKEIEAANKETITYWRGEVARLTQIITGLCDEIDFQNEIATDEEFAQYVCIAKNTARAALGE